MNLDLFVVRAWPPGARNVELEIRPAIASERNVAHFATRIRGVAKRHNNRRILRHIREAGWLSLERCDGRKIPVRIDVAAIAPVRDPE